MPHLSVSDPAFFIYGVFLRREPISRHGFISPVVFLQLLRPEEVEMLVCGSPELDMSALQKAAQYEGYGRTDATVR